VRLAEIGSMNKNNIFLIFAIINAAISVKIQNDSGQNSEENIELMLKSIYHLILTVIWMLTYIVF
jgi:hypothetical protein